MTKTFRKHIKTTDILQQSIKIVKAFFLVLLFYGVGEALSHFIEIGLPGSIVGMLLIFTALKTKLIRLRTVKPASDFLVKYMMLFFVPFGVGLMMYFDFIKSYWLVLSVAATGSVLMTLYTTAWLLQKLEKDDAL